MNYNVKSEITNGTRYILTTAQRPDKIVECHILHGIENIMSNPRITSQICSITDERKISINDIFFKCITNTKFTFLNCVFMKRHKTFTASICLLCIFYLHFLLKKLSKSPF